MIMVQYDWNLVCIVVHLLINLQLFFKTKHMLVIVLFLSLIPHILKIGRELGRNEEKERKEFGRIGKRMDLLLLLHRRVYPNVIF